MVLSWEQTHLKCTGHADMAVQATKISFALNISKMKWSSNFFSHANPNSPAYCLANLATSSLLNTYCLLANQCRNNSTVRTVTPANTRSLEMILSRDMAEKKNAQTHRDRFGYMHIGRQTGVVLRSQPLPGQVREGTLRLANHGPSQQRRQRATPGLPAQCKTVFF